MLRQRKNKRYNEETHDDKGEGGRTYNLKDKIRSPRFEELRELQVLPGDRVSLKLIQRNGFEKPILVETPTGLDLRVPPKSFTVRDVGKLVGQDRLIDVMDVKTQKNIQMTMREWCKYYDSRQKDRLLNVISLEFSHTDLDDEVNSPRIVRHLDWVDQVWPKFLKESQTESTNTIDKMKYPKVQKYCLMSVKGSYTDFHIDFGGTSVWYHILRGKKMFWMCPPTELNLQAFEEWTLSGMQQDVFFGDTVEECFRVELSAGNTFFIPSGWIHAVYTMEDSLVFGGNFLHSFGIENQLKVSRIEDATRVPLKFRYPFYTEILWYVVQHYVHCLTGKSHLHSIAVTTTPEKTPQKSRDKLQARAHTGDTTESEQDESDNRKQVMPRKRGRLPRSALVKRPKKPPTDDESTEIDSDLEDVKPNKSTATCRMTKNSLLRLQYEIDDFGESQVSRKKSSNDSTQENDSKVKRMSRKPTKELTSKTDFHLQPSESEALVEGDRLNLSQSILSQDATRSVDKLNQVTGHQMTWSKRESDLKEPMKIHITKYEVNGLRLLVKHLSKLSGVKKNLPALIRNSRALLDDCKRMIAEHENDDPELAASDVPIGPELLSPKKSDINQLIEQFFKPTETIDGASVQDSSDTLKIKSDSSTLTHQQRIKYMQIPLPEIKGDKKNLATSETSTSGTKNTSPVKKTTVSLSPSLAVVASATTSLSADQPRAKSPPTRPLSNKQYTSKTKKDNSLVLPGSFADLIAATSTAKEVFDVSSAEVTSTLFGLKPSSPNKIVPQNQKPRDRPKSTEAVIPQKPQVGSTDGTQPSTSIVADQSPARKANSPEPPKMQPTKRLINPAFKPQNKERLIFASEPYVSPARAMDNSRSPHFYPWQSLAPHQQQSQTHSRNDQPNFPASISNQDTPQHTSSTPNLEPARRSSVINQPPVKREVVSKPIIEKMDISICPVYPTINRMKMSRDRGSMMIRDPSRVDVIEKPVKLTDHKEPVRSSLQDSTTALKSAPGPSNDAVTPKQKTSFTIDHIMAPSENSADDVELPSKPVKPRGPPKKSKEARQVLDSEASVQTTPVAVPPLVAEPQPAGTIGSLVTTVAHIGEGESDKAKPRAKRPKKQTDGTHSTNNQPPIISSQVRPQQLICGLVTQPKAATSGVAISAASKVNPQQLRPLAKFNDLSPMPASNMNSGQPRPLPRYCLLPNSMSTFSPNQQKMPRPSSNMMPTFFPTTMGLSGIQPGARIVWAARPPAVSGPSTAGPTLPIMGQHITTESKEQALTASLADKQSDQAALLSLATTALSTAPLPTTPTLSHISARGPTVSQALIVNPMLSSQASCQQLFNPLFPVFSRSQFILGGAPNPMVTTGLPPKPAAPRQTGQLLFTPMPGQVGQPRYLITQPGFLPHRPQTSQLFATQQVPTTLTFPAFRPPAATTTKAEPVKVKKVKIR